MIEEAIRNPDQAGVGYKGRTLVYKSYANKRIKVVYTKTTEQFVVISVMWD